MVRTIDQLLQTFSARNMVQGCFDGKFIHSKDFAATAVLL